MSSTPMLTVLEEDKHWWFASRTRAILAYLDRYVGPGRNLQVLDVGCGAGNMMHHLAHYGRVTGVDNNPKPLEVAQQRGLDVRQGTADALPFGEGEFDLLTVLDTVEHVPAEAQVFDECCRVLRQGGQAPGHRSRVHVPVEPQRRDQHAPAALHGSRAARASSRRTASACCASPTTTSSSSRWPRC